MLLRDLIPGDLAVVQETDTIRHAVQLVRSRRQDAVPVVAAGGRLVGVLTRSNICDVILANISPDLPVSTVMVREPTTLREGDPFSDVQALIAHSPVGQAVVVNAAGHPVGLFTKSIAVFELQRQTEVLARHLAAVVDAVEHGVVAVNADGLVTVFNRAAATLYGLEPDAVLGRPAASVIPELPLGHVLATGRPQERLRHTLGSRAVMTNCRLIPGLDVPVGAIAVIHDISQLDQLAGELEGTRQLSRTLETVLEIAYDGVIVVDHQGRITLVNRNMSEFLRKPVGELVGRHITEVMENTRLHIVAQTGEAEHNDVQVIRGTRYVVSRLPIIRDGSPSGAVGTVSFQGLRELRGMVQQLEGLERNLAGPREETRSGHRARYTFEHIIGVSPEMERARQEARSAALSNAPVLILGPSGTGKELFAHAIHNAGPRRGSPFLKVNCAAVPEDLLESEFFGYESGAFTGARSQGKKGKFELADGGTLFLDEIGDMSLRLQAKLLRVLQDGEFERVAGTRPTRVDVRAIAATNRDLHAMVQTGQFRLDLYYRLNVLTVQVPALSDRRDDIPPLVQSLIARFNRELSTRVVGPTPAALALLKAYAWPGNVRELENAIRRAMHLAAGEYIEVENLPSHLRQAGIAASGPPESPDQPVYVTALHQHERELIEQALTAAEGSRTEAAKRLGISRAGLYEKMRRLGLPTRKR